MPDLAQGYSAKVVLDAGERVRVSTTGQATVTSAYGAPAGTTTLTANTQVFGPYQVPAKLLITAVAGACTYAQPTQVPVTADPSTGEFSPPVSNAGNGTVAVIGDSFSARWFNSDPTTVNYHGKGFITWALAKVGGGLTVISDSSIGGAYVSNGGPVTPLVTQVTTAVASGAKNLLMGGGLNDVIAGVSSDTIKAAWGEILAKARAAGMRVWWWTQPGLDPTGAGATYTTARQAQIFELNRWIKQQANTSAVGSIGNVTVIDLAGVVQDPASATGAWRAGLLNSTEPAPRLHPSQPGAMVMGFALAPAFTAGGLISPPVLPTSNADNKAYDANSDILNSNGLFVSGAGTATGYTTAITGGAAVTPSLAARSDGYGNDQVLTGTFAANGDSFSHSTADLKASMTLGRWYRLVCELNTASSTNLRCVRVQLVANATTSMFSNWGQLDSDSDPDAPFAQELAGVVAVTKPFQYTAGMGTVASFFGIVRAFGAGAGGTTLKIGRLAVEELAVEELAAP